MKVVLCSLNSQYIHSSLAPWCLLAGVKQYGNSRLQVSVVEGTVNEDLAAVAERIIRLAPKCIGFCCYIWNIQRVHQLLPLIKTALPQTVVVLGGPEVGYCAHEVLTEHPLVDYVLTGEGERSFAHLCNALLSGESPMVAGVSGRQDGTVFSVPEAPLEEEPPSPYCDAYFAALNGRITYLETSRGCPYACAYCLSARCGKLKFFSVERAKREMLLLAKSGTKTVKLVDRTFNAHRERAKDLWRFIIENYGTNIPEGVCFHFEIAGDLLDDEAIDIIQTAPTGSMQFEVGIQSFHEPTLAYIRRKTDLQKLCHRVRRLLEKGNVHVHIDLIAGLPLEDFDTFGQSVNQAYALGANMLQLGFLKLIHGSPMREDPHRYPCSYHSMPPYEVTETPVLSEHDLARLHQAEWAVDKLYNSGHFFGSLPYVLSVSGQTPFNLFLAFGEWVTEKQGAPLSRVAHWFYEFALTQGADAVTLRDVMVCDWLSTVKGGQLPPFLQREDPRLSTFRKFLRKNSATKPLAGVARGSALLYGETQGVYVDYVNQDPVTGRYVLHQINWEGEDDDASL